MMNRLSEIRDFTVSAAAVMAGLTEEQAREEFRAFGATWRYWTHRNITGVPVETAFAMGDVVRSHPAAWVGSGHVFAMTKDGWGEFVHLGQTFDLEAEVEDLAASMYRRYN